MTRLACLTGKSVVLLTHEISQTGAPMILVETAIEMQKSGATVALVNLGRDSGKKNLAERNRVPVMSVRDSFRRAAEADLVIANTAVTKEWVRAYLDTYPSAARRLIWWIHEIDAKMYSRNLANLDKVASVIFDSNASRRSWRATGIGLPDSTAVVHPSVCDRLRVAATQARFPFEPNMLLRALGVKRLFARHAIRQRLGIRSADFVLSLFGSFIPTKGHRLFMQTVQGMLETLPQLRLKVMLIGFWSNRQRFRFLSELTTVGRQVLEPQRALTHVDDLSPYYAASDAFVMNSQHLGENFGRVTIEAMAFKLPVLGTDAGGTPEIVVDQVTGLLYPVGEEGQASLTDNIRMLIDDRERARALGEAGFNRVHEYFTDARFYRELARIIEGVLDRAH